MRHPIVATLLATFSLLVGAALQAQATRSTLADMRTSIIRAIGADDQTVEITVDGNILTVSRVNSNMHQGTHAGRDNEATAIASIVSKAISGKQEFEKLITGLRNAS